MSLTNQTPSRVIAELTSPELPIFKPGTTCCKPLISIMPARSISSAPNAEIEDDTSCKSCERRLVVTVFFQFSLSQHL
jgi:hypothetical protein